MYRKCYGTVIDKLSPIRFSRISHKRLTLLIPDAETTYQRYYIHPLEMGKVRLYNHKYPSHIEKAYRTGPDSPICDKVRFARMSAKLKQNDLAEMLDIDRSTLIRLEGGQVTEEHINTELLIKIAEICGVEKTFCCDEYHSFLVNCPETIITFRKKYGLRQREFAALMGVAQTTVKRWEKSKAKMSKENYLTFRKLLVSKNVPLDEYHEFILAGPALIIKRFRETCGLSQAEFAKKLGLSFSTIQFWEQNRNLPNKESFEVLSKAFREE